MSDQHTNETRELDLDAIEANARHWDHLVRDDPETTLALVAEVRALRGDLRVALWDLAEAKVDGEEAYRLMQERYGRTSAQLDAANGEAATLRLVRDGDGARPDRDDAGVSR